MNEIQHYTVAWDLETTGFQDDPNAHITEIGAMVLRDGVITDRKSWILNHGIEIPEEITKITGITKELIDAEGVDPVIAIAQFIDVLNQAENHITHNGYRFDIPFLVKEITYLNRPDLFGHPDAHKRYQRQLEENMIDTAVMYKARKMGLKQLPLEHPRAFAKRVMDIRAYGVKYNVGIACDELGIDRSNITQHRALGDIELTVEIFKKLI